MKTLKYGSILAFCLALTGCAGCTRVNPGYVGVKSTLMGTGRGLSDVAVGPAWVTYNAFTESVLEYPTFVQTAVWTANKDEGHPVNEEITFTCKEGLQVAADISIGYSLQPEKVPAFYIKFRSEDLNGFTHGFLRNMARDKFDAVGGRYGVEQIMGDNGPYLNEVRKALQDEIAPYGVHLEQFGFIGAPRPPGTVISAINAKVQATQLALQKQNEIVQMQAEAQKDIAAAEGHSKAVLINAEAQATANKKLAESLSPSFVEYQKILKWDGKLPQVQGGSSGLMLSLPGK